MDTYDDRQAAAVLVTCAGCGHAFYMVVPQPLCIVCRRAA
jgi:hypothetical protein